MSSANRQSTTGDIDGSARVCTLDANANTNPHGINVMTPSSQRA